MRRVAQTCVVAAFTAICGTAISDNLVLTNPNNLSSWSDVTHLLDVTQAPSQKCGGCTGSPIPAGATLIDTSGDGNYLLFSSLDPNVIPGEQNLPGVNNLYWMDITKGPENAVIRLVTHFAGSTTASAGYFGIAKGLVPLTFEPQTADLSGDGQTVVFDSRINANAYDATVPAANDMPSIERDRYGELVLDNATSDVFVWHASAPDPSNNIAAVDLLNTSGKKVALSLKQALNALFSSDQVPPPDITKPVVLGVFITTPRYLSLKSLIQRGLIDPLLNFIEVVTEAATNQGLSENGKTVLYQSDLPAQWIDRKNPNIKDDDIMALELTVPLFNLLKMSLDGFVVRDTNLPNAAAIDNTNLTQTVTLDVDGNAQGYFNYSAYLQQLITAFPIMPPMFFEAEFLQLSADGNRVAFASRQTASRLISGVTDSDFSQDVFLFDIALNGNILVSRNLDNPQRTAGSTQAPFQDFISAWFNGVPYAYELMDSANLSLNSDGTVVAIQSSAKDLIAGFIDNNVEARPAALRWNTFSNAFFEHFGPLDLYSVALGSGLTPTSKTTLINTPNGVANTNLSATLYGLSSDGKVAYFETAGNNFYKVPFNDPHYNPTFAAGLLDTNVMLGGFNNLWKRDINDGTISLVTQSYAKGVTANKGSVPTPTAPGSRDILSTVSDSGRFVLFDNSSNNLAEGINDPAFKGGVFLRDTELGVTTLMSTKATGNAPSIGLFLQTSLGSANDQSGLVRVFMGGTNAEDMQTQYANDQIDNGLTPHFYSVDYPRLVKASSGENPALISVSGENYNYSIIDFKRGGLTIKTSPTPEFVKPNSRGAQVGTGDVNGDGVADYLYGSPANHAPQVVVIDGANGSVILNQMLRQRSFLNSGVFVTAGDLDGDGYADVAVSYGNGINQSAIEVYSGRRGFNLLKHQLSGQGAGKNDIAIGNVEGDARPEIIVGSRVSSAHPNQINIFKVVENPLWNAGANDYSIEPLLAAPSFEFRASELKPRKGGVYIATSDMDGDGYDEIVAGSANGPYFTVYQRNPLTGLYSIALDVHNASADIQGDSAYANGVRVAARPGLIITGSGRGGSEVRIYSFARLKNPQLGLNPIVQQFKPSQTNRWGKGRAVAGLNVG